MSADKQAHVVWPEELYDLGQGNTVSERMRVALHHALRRLDAARAQFDVALVYFPDRWLPHLRTKEFDAHDELKALGAQLGIPTQVINDKSLKFGNWGARAWRLSVALYAKAGGTPWKLAPIEGIPEDTAYIGLAYAIRRSADEAHYVTCCSQVFDMEGGGMQFIAFEANDAIADEAEARRNPFLSQADMRAVLTRSVRLYWKSHAGRVPRRLVIHKTTAFTESETQRGAGRNAIDPGGRMHRNRFKRSLARRLDGQTPPQQTQHPTGALPVPRGTLVMTSGSSALLWLAGQCPVCCRRPRLLSGRQEHPETHCHSSSYGAWSL